MLDLVSSYKKQQASSITIPKEILKELQEVFQADKKYFGISLGSNTPKRIWDYKKFIDVAKYFEAKGFEIVFFLGPQETHLKEDIINQIKKPMFPLFKPKTGILKSMLCLIAESIAPSPPTATMTSALEISTWPYNFSNS